MLMIVFSIKTQAIGLRYILPVYPLMFVLIFGLAERGWHRGRRGLLLGALLVWYVVSSVAIHPHYLAYFNEVAGGPSGGHRYLVDSNLDWGQDLKGLKRFMQEQDIEKIHLSYFGTDVPSRYSIAYEWLPIAVLDNPNPEQQIPNRATGWIAISVTNLQGTYFANQNLFQYLRQYEPVARIGHSIHVCHLPP